MTRPGLPEDWSVLPARSYFAVTIAAVNRLVAAGLEGYLRILAALSANRREHLAAAGTIAIAAASGTLGLPCLTAIGTALGFVSVALGLIKVLFVGGEGESSSAIGALE